LTCGPRRIFASPWIYAGAVLAVALWTPYLLWQAHHSWPELTIAKSIANGQSGTSVPRPAFLPNEILMVGFFFTPMYIAGVGRLLRNPMYRWCRSLGVAWIVMNVVFIAQAGKPYYLAPIFPVVFAAGAPWFLEWSERKPSRRTAPQWAVGLSMVGFLITLPIVPLAALHDTPIVAANYDAGETVGWPSFVHEIADVYDSVPSGQRTQTVILGSNYGETGAVDRYGPGLGLPTAYGVSNATWLWGPPPATMTEVEAIGFDRDQLTPYFSSVRLATKLNNHVHVDDDEQSAPVWICSGMQSSWTTIWPKLKDYGG
jgi:hypothetical protein